MRTRKEKRGSLQRLRTSRANRRAENRKASEKEGRANLIYRLLRPKKESGRFAKFPRGPALRRAKGGPPPVPSAARRFPAGVSNTVAAWPGAADEKSRVFSPRRAICEARAAEQGVLPTSPLPASIISWMPAKSNSCMIRRDQRAGDSRSQAVRRQSGKLPFKFFPGL